MPNFAQLMVLTQMSANDVKVVTDDRRQFSFLLEGMGIRIFKNHRLIILCYIYLYI